MAKKLSGTEQVEAFLAQLEHPLKPEIQHVRELVLQAKPGITEQIKWNAPSFCYQQDDRITFNLQGKGFFRLIFHLGAKARSNQTTERLIQDESGLLEWPANDRAILKFTDLSDVLEKKEALHKLVNSWLDRASVQPETA